MTSDDPRAVYVRDEVLGPHAGARRLVLDEHMFDPGLRDGFLYSRCRLQVFAAPGLRTVAVATQTMQDGQSIINAAERYVEAVWKRVCPAEPQPPIWVQNLIEDSERLRPVLVRFTVTGPHTVTGPPRWGPGIVEEELARLVGARVDLTRGRQVPRELEPEPEVVLEPALVARLPRVDAEADRACRPGGISRARLLGRQLRPRRGGQDCCWYHGGDWHEVSAMALAGVRRAGADGLREQVEVAVRVTEQAEHAGWTGWRMQALRSLVLDPIQVHEDGSGHVNGRHRTQALQEAGVRRTVVGNLRYLRPRAGG